MEYRRIGFTLNQLTTPTKWKGPTVLSLVIRENKLVQWIVPLRAISREENLVMDPCDKNENNVTVRNIRVVLMTYGVSVGQYPNTNDGLPYRPATENDPIPGSRLHLSSFSPLLYSPVISATNRRRQQYLILKVGVLYFVNAWVPKHSPADVITATLSWNTGQVEHNQPVLCETPSTPPKPLMVASPNGKYVIPVGHSPPMIDAGLSMIKVQ